MQSHLAPLPRSGRSPLAVAGVGLLGYLFLFSLFLNHLGDVTGFIQIGTSFVNRSHASTAIRIEPGYNYPENGFGYDGQFNYFIALDPVNARYYLDNDSYRFTGILYPITARLLALGRADWVPASLILTNILFVTLGTLAVYITGRSPRSGLWAHPVFGLAALARETTLVFAALYVIRPLFERNPGEQWLPSVRKSALFACLAIGPALLWQGY